MKGINLLKQARENPPKPPKMKVLKGIRKFRIPDLNWNATSWNNIISWDGITLSEPRILKNLTIEQIETAVQDPMIFPEYPCHSQTVERMVSW